MKAFIKDKKSIVVTVIYGIIWAGLLLLGLIFLVKHAYFQALGCLLWEAVFTFFYFIRKGSFLHNILAYSEDKKTNRRTDIAMAVTALLLILGTVLPMGAAPAYNGEFPEHRNQYELTARAFAEGHLNIAYDDIDPMLEEMNNPYDPGERAETGVEFYRDHAYYKGKYYMYFGVTPVILLFLPYHLITGGDLTTYHATQIFSAISIIAIFLLMRQLAKKFFPKMSALLLICLSTAFSFISTYFAIGTPALYCTATSSAVCMEALSLLFLTGSIFITDPEKRGKQVFLAVLGTLFGAMAFGCKPTAALGNLVAIPLCVIFVKGRLSLNTKNKIIKIVADIALIAIPYIVIGILLMCYNYARFESPFEFGQAYQLTGADQHNYGNFFETFSTVRTVNGILNNFIGFTPIIGTFPYVYYNSAFVNFPLLLFVFGVFSKTVRTGAGRAKMKAFMGTLFALPLIITVMQIAWAPGDGTAERYRMDVYVFMVLLAFLVIGFFNETLSQPDMKRINSVICFFCLIAVLMGVLFLLFPDDYNYTQWFPESLENWRKVFMLH